MKYTPVVEMLHGSHLYRLNTETSDHDYKGVFIPHPKDIVMGTVKDTIDSSTGTKSSKNTKEDVDHQMYSLAKFIRMASVGDTVALDMLHADNDVLLQNSPEWQYIIDNRWRFYTSELTGLFGYVRKQAAKYGVKGSRLAALRQVVDVLKKEENFIVLDHADPGADTVLKVGHIQHLFPVNEFCRFVEMDLPEKGGPQRFYEVLGRKYQMTISVEEMSKSIMKLWTEYGDRAREAEKNNGIDWKALSHALRGGYQLIQIYEDGGFTYPLKHSGMLRAVKAGEVSFQDVQKELEYVMDRVEKLAAVTLYPEKVDMDFWNDFIEKVYSEHVLAYYKL